jgi:hypothetical protein
LRALEKRVLRTIFGHKREGVIGGWRKLHNDELDSLCSSPDIIEMMNTCTRNSEK